MIAPVSTLFLLPSSGFVYHGRIGGKPRHDYSLEATVFLASANGRHRAGIYEVRGETYEQVASIYRPQDAPARIEAMYKTAQTAVDLPGIDAGQFVAIVKYHDYNNTYTIRSIDGVLQAMVSPACLTRFCL